LEAKGTKPFKLAPPVDIAPQALAPPLLLPLLVVFTLPVFPLAAEVELAAVLEPPEQPIPADNRANTNKAGSVGRIRERPLPYLLRPGGFPQRA
jgi:hypothetical protein